MAERPLQVGDQVKMGLIVGPVVATDDQGFTIDWPDIHRRAYAWHNADEFTVVSRAAVIATLDDGVEVRRGRDVPEGWEWRYNEDYSWRNMEVSSPELKALVECRPKPPETVTIELHEDRLREAMQMAWDAFVADTGCFPDCIQASRNVTLTAEFWRGNFVRHVVQNLEALERRGRDDG